MNFEIRVSDQLSDKYQNLVTQIHGDTEMTRAFIEDSVKGFETFKKNGKPIIIEVYWQHKLQGQIAILPTTNNESFWGFMECTGYNVFECLWEWMMKKARELNISVLFGPVNGTIWHPYRFISKTNGEPFFPSEPVSSTDYHTWVISKQPKQVIEYHSAYRTNFNTIRQTTEKSFFDVLDQHFTIGTEKVDRQNIESLFKLASEVFSSNPGFTALSINEFIELYSNQKIEKHQSLVYTVRKNGELIGFSLNHIFNKTLIMKTIAVLPTMQQMGIGNALVFKVHTDAIHSGIEKIIYALIRKDNQVKHFPTDHITIFREYCTYLFDVL